MNDSNGHFCLCVFLILVVSVPTFSVVSEAPRSPSPLMIVDDDDDDDDDDDEDDDEPSEGVPIEQYRAWLGKCVSACRSVFECVYYSVTPEFWVWTNTLINIVKSWCLLSLFRFLNKTKTKQKTNKQRACNYLFIYLFVFSHSLCYAHVSLSPDEDSNLEPSSLGELDSSSLLGPMDEEERWLEALEKGELDDNGELKKEIDESLLTARQVG